MLDKVCGILNFYEAIPFGVRLLAILLENDKLDEKQLLIEYLTLLYNNNASLYLQATRTIEDGELDSNPNNFDKAFDDGDLNCNEFNNSSTKNKKIHRVERAVYKFYNK